MEFYNSALELELQLELSLQLELELYSSRRGAEFLTVQNVENVEKRFRSRTRTPTRTNLTQSIQCQSHSGPACTIRPGMRLSHLLCRQSSSRLPALHFGIDKIPYPRRNPLGRFAYLPPLIVRIPAGHVRDNFPSRVPLAEPL